MNELLSNWKLKSNQQFDGEENSELRRRRRMTTTIGRSIEIQTEQKVCQEKGISTEGNSILLCLFLHDIVYRFISDWQMPSTSQFNSEKPQDQEIVPPKSSPVSKEMSKQSSSQMSILDMPNEEGEQSHYFDPLLTAGRASTEPVVEMYDSDTSFDAADQTNFEKNMEFIYNQISRRALNQNRMMAQKDVPLEKELNQYKVIY